ncbi:MAG: electron carrier [Trizodia sp. TS-e1964]|nr:MAG: electron carrier [Trizodia sp. TS-e1964]
MDSENISQRPQRPVFYIVFHPAFPRPTFTIPSRECLVYWPTYSLDLAWQRAHSDGDLILPDLMLPKFVSQSDLEVAAVEHIVYPGTEAGDGAMVLLLMPPSLSSHPEIVDAVKAAHYNYPTDFQMLDRIHRGLATLQTDIYDVVTLLSDADGSRCESKKLLGRREMEIIAKTLREGGRLTSMDKTFADDEASDEFKEAILAGLVKDGQGGMVKPVAAAAAPISLPPRASKSSKKKKPKKAQADPSKNELESKLPELAKEPAIVELSMSNLAKETAALKYNTPDLAKEPAIVESNASKVTMEPAIVESNKPDLSNEPAILETDMLALTKEPATPKSNPAKLTQEGEIIVSDNIYSNDETINEYTLLGSKEILMPDSYNSDCSPEEAGKRRKACKDCTCGLKERLDARDEVERAVADGLLLDIKLNRADLFDTELDFTVEGKVGSCGNCALGDAFRCEGCPYVGMPSFKPGEEVRLLNNMPEL